MTEPKLQRRDFLKAAAVGGAAVLARSRMALGDESRSRQPNVLLIVADDQRHDTIHALGNSLISTPNFDRLIGEGFTFERCRTMGSHTTGAVCVPSRAMLHTGRYLFRVPDNIGDHTVIGQALEQAGYKTFGCGKWHNGPHSFARGFNDGARIFFGGMNWDQYKLHYQDFDPAGRYPKNATKLASAFSTDFYTEAACDYLKKQTGDQPFFCYLAFTSPHDPRTPPPPYDTMYKPADMPLQKNWMPRPWFDNGDMDERDEKLAPMPRTEADTKKQLCDYYGMVTSQDAAVGRMLKALEASGQADNTIVIYTGDHGLCIGSHGLFGKQNVYEEAVGVPLIITGPGVTKGKSSALCYGADIFPTLCELLKIDKPASVDGKSLAGVMNGSKDRVRDSVYNAFFHHAQTQESVRDERWKMIRYRIHDQDRVQLFDLENDPAETKDLVDDAQAKQQIPRLDALMKQWQHDAGRLT